MQKSINSELPNVWFDARKHPPEEGQAIIGIDRGHHVHRLIRVGVGYFFNCNHALPNYAPPMFHPIWWIPEPEYITELEHEKDQ